MKKNLNLVDLLKGCNYWYCLLQLVILFTAMYVRRVIDRDDEVVSPCMGYENKLKYYKGDDDISEQETWEITYINISSPIL